MFILGTISNDFKLKSKITPSENGRRLRMTVGQYLESIRNFLFPSIDLFLSHP